MDALSGAKRQRCGDEIIGGNSASGAGAAAETAVAALASLSAARTPPVAASAQADLMPPPPHRGPRAGARAGEGAAAAALASLSAAGSAQADLMPPPPLPVTAGGAGAAATAVVRIISASSLLRVLFEPEKPSPLVLSFLTLKDLECFRATCLFFKMKLQETFTRRSYWRIEKMLGVARHLCGIDLARFCLSGHSQFPFASRFANFTNLQVLEMDLSQLPVCELDAMINLLPTFRKLRELKVSGASEAHAVRIMQSLKGRLTTVHFHNLSLVSSKTQRLFVAALKGIERLGLTYFRVEGDISSFGRSLPKSLKTLSFSVPQFDKYQLHPRCLIESMSLPKLERLSLAEKVAREIKFYIGVAMRAGRTAQNLKVYALDPAMNTPFA